MADPHDREALITNGGSIQAPPAGRPDGEAPGTKKLRLKSLKTVYMTNFLSAIGFSILMSSVWPFLQSVGGTEKFLGYVVGAFSIGQLVGAPFWGTITVNNSYKVVLLVTIFLRLGGNVVYAMAGGFDHATAAPYVTLGARGAVGFGAGAMAVCSAYVAGATPVEERGKAMGALAASGGLGFIFGPLLGIAFVKLKPGYQEGFLELDYLTMPAYLAAFFCVVNMFCFSGFREFRINEKRVSTVSTNGNASQDDVKEAIKQSASDPDRDNLAVLVCLFVYFTNMVSLSVFETMGTPYAMYEFGWTAQEAELYNGIITGVGGLESVMVFIIAPALAQKHGDRAVMLAGVCLCIISQGLLAPWGLPSDNQYQPYCFEEFPYKWCRFDPPLPLWQYLLSCFFVNAGFPFVTVMSTTIFSKVLGPFPQGFWMGLLNACGSLARAVGPIVTTQLYTSYGPTKLYLGTAAFTGLSVLVILATYRRLIVHKLQRIPEAGSSLVSVLSTHNDQGGSSRAQGDTNAQGVYEDD